MKTLLATLAAVAAVTAAVPAAAQGYGYGDRYAYGYEHYDRHDRAWRGGYHLNQRQRDLLRLIERGERRGDLTGHEARVLLGEFHELARIEARMRHRGLHPRERAILDRRLDRLEVAVIRNIRDGQREYGHGYGRWR